MCSRVTTSLRALLDTGGVGGVNSSADTFLEVLFTPMPLGTGAAGPAARRLRAEFPLILI
jgi:hypothetical protein